MTIDEVESNYLNDLHRVLREELQGRSWGVRQLSDALDVKFGVAARWVSEDPATRVVPRPRTLVQIADLFELDTIEAFRHAGYLPVKLKDGGEHPHEEEIQALLRRFLRLLKSIPESQWRPAISVVSLDLDHLAALLTRLDDWLP